MKDTWDNEETRRVNELLTRTPAHYDALLDIAHSSGTVAERAHQLERRFAETVDWDQIIHKHLDD